VQFLSAVPLPGTLMAKAEIRSSETKRYNRALRKGECQFHIPKKL
jgi:hypothetical protein